MTANLGVKYEEGFTAVELLITLFIAALFLFSGYQLYAQVMRNSTDANQNAKISNVLYEKMQTASNAVTAANPGGCTSSNEGTSSESKQVEGIGSVTLATTVSCPQGANTSTNLFLIKVRATYSFNGTSKQMEYATYAN